MFKSLIEKAFPFDGERILFFVLNWGLGHATRSTPIIRFLKQNNTVFIGSDGVSGRYLQAEFPDLQYHPLPGYNMTYPHAFMPFNLLRKAPGILRAIYHEHKITNRWVNENRVNVVISDHRYGCYSKYASKNIVIAHQLNIFLPGLHHSRILSYLNQKMLNQFDTCCIPDFDDHFLSGELSHPTYMNHPYFIGPLSRFTANGMQIEYDAAIILSGPEPSRSKLENLLVRQASACRYRFILVRGVEGAHHFDFPNIKVRSLVCTNSLQEIFDKSNIVICRPGYSSVMDLTYLRKRAVLIPTPGQTEQEYIAKRLKGKDGLVVLRENKFRLEEAMAQLLS